ncbi:PTS sugar transporter subunit IIA [Escherichia coli]
MTNNDTTLQLSSVLNRECTRSRVHCQSKKRALEIISELAAKQLSLPPQVVFEAILTRKKWAVPVSAMVLPFRMANWKKILCCWRFSVQLETPIAFDAIDNQPVDLLFALLVPADQTETHLHTLSLVAKTSGGQNHLPPFTRSPGAMKSCIKSLRIPKVLRMKRSYSVMSLLDVVRRNSTWY